MNQSALLPRRHFAVLIAAASLAFPQLAAAGFPPGSDITGRLPDLAFDMTRSSDGKRVTAAGYRGKVVVLFFGFTRCPDVCPLTVHNMAMILQRMGPLAGEMRFLFITIDLAHDTLPRLKRFLANFGPPPEIDGLHGTPAELAALAKRYYVQYQAPSGPNSPDPVSKITHISCIYVFGPHGRVRYLVNDFAGSNLDFAAMTAGFDRLAKAAREP
ncbi:MAG: SCO family protein [Rhodospirillales bacterium]|nr:SCO family protein [Rhodospirillales bacterium]